jgi:hypothetical protein
MQINLERLRSAPWKHQALELEHAEDPARALLWQMRTGKTKAVIDQACHLYERGLINGLLIVAPNGVHSNWTRLQIPRHMWAGIDATSLCWRASTAGANAPAALRGEFAEAFKVGLKSSPFFMCSFNSESVIRDDVRRLIAHMVKKRKLMAVWDECSDFRRPGSKRTKMMRAVATKVDYRRILDGTAVTNSPLHAFSQFELLEKEALGFRTFEDFRMHYADWVKRGERWVVKRWKNQDELKARMARFASVVLRADCEDLPDLETRTRLIALTPEQKRVYKEVHNRLVKLNELDVGVGADTPLIFKLQQVTSGFLIDEFGDAHMIPGDNPRLEAALQEIEECAGRVIVWCQWQRDIDLLKDAVKRSGWGFVEYHGRVSERDKVKALKAWEGGAVKVFIGQPQAGGRGLEIPADMVLWYSHTFNTITRLQAQERATIMGGKNVQIVDLVAAPVDSYILDRLGHNIAVADDIAGRGLQQVLRELEL